MLYLDPPAKFVQIESTLVPVDNPCLTGAIYYFYCTVLSGGKLNLVNKNHAQEKRITDHNHTKIIFSPFEGRVCWHWMCHSCLHATLSAHWLCKMFQGYPMDENQWYVTKMKSNVDQSEIGEWFCTHFVKMLIIWLEKLLKFGQNARVTIT